MRTCDCISGRGLNILCKEFLCRHGVSLRSFTKVIVPLIARRENISDFCHVVCDVQVSAKQHWVRLPGEKECLMGSGKPGQNNGLINLDLTHVCVNMPSPKTVPQNQTAALGTRICPHCLFIFDINDNYVYFQPVEMTIMINTQWKYPGNIFDQQCVQHTSRT